MYSGVQESRESAGITTLSSRARRSRSKNDHFCTLLRKVEERRFPELVVGPGIKGVLRRALFLSVVPHSRTRAVHFEIFLCRTTSLAVFFCSFCLYILDLSAYTSA